MAAVVGGIVLLVAAAIVAAVLWYRRSAAKKQEDAFTSTMAVRSYISASNPLKHPYDFDQERRVVSSAVAGGTLAGSLYNPTSNVE